MTLDLTAPVDAADHVRGASGGGHLVVYGDFECPYTGASVQEIGRLLERATPTVSPRPGSDRVSASGL